MEVEQDNYVIFMAHISYKLMTMYYMILEDQVVVNFDIMLLLLEPEIPSYK